VEYLFFRHVFGFGAAFLSALYFVPLVVRAARRLSFLDRPDGNVKQHVKPVPYLGGVAVFVAFCLTIAFVYPFENKILWLISGTTFLLFLGLVDDLNVLSPLKKITGQLLAVLCLLKGGFAFKTDFFTTLINVAASGFWMLSVINAFNLVDVMDGLATLLAIVSGASLFIIALVLGVYEISLLLITLLGALAAFFWYNKPPAKIYLGDAGALFIGGFIAAVALLFPWMRILREYSALPSLVRDNLFLEVVVSAIVPIVLVGLPLLEVTCLVVIRRWKGIPFYRGSPHHFSIYLQRRGWSVTRVLMFVGVVSSALAVFATSFMFGAVSFWLFLSGLIFFLIFWLFFIFFKI